MAEAKPSACFKSLGGAPDTGITDATRMTLVFQRFEYQDFRSWEVSSCATPGGRSYGMIPSPVTTTSLPARCWPSEQTAAAREPAERKPDACRAPAGGGLVKAKAVYTAIRILAAGAIARRASSAPSSDCAAIPGPPGSSP